MFLREGLENYFRLDTSEMDVSTTADFRQIATHQLTRVGPVDYTSESVARGE